MGRDNKSPFQLVSEDHRALKADDKDNYVAIKISRVARTTRMLYLGNTAKKMYSYLINRMCASILFRVSRKQQLNDKAIDKLMKCITNFEGLVSALELTKGLCGHVCGSNFASDTGI